MYTPVAFSAGAWYTAIRALGASSSAMPKAAASTAETRITLRWFIVGSLLEEVVRGAAAPLSVPGQGEWMPFARRRQAAHLLDALQHREGAVLEIVHRERLRQGAAWAGHVVDRRLRKAFAMPRVAALARGD